MGQILQHRDRLQVFVSSVMTDEDLTVERDAVCRAISSLQLTVPWVFEYAPAESSPATTVYLREVAASDLVVLIVSDSHTRAVQDELDEAEANNRPVLAFVRRKSPNEAISAGRGEVLRWLRDRVKYREFGTIDDLEQAVIDAITSELVRGYRQFRMAQEDIAELLRRTSSPPGLLVRSMRPEEQSAVRDVLLELDVWYPEIRPWINKVLGGMGADDVRVAELAHSIAGVALSRSKGAGVRKFSTIYIRPDHRGEAIGPHLVHAEVTRAAREGIRTAYVTFADELLDLLQPILSRYGFVIQGVSPGRYRPGSAEWVMGKSFVHDVVTPDDFERFVDRYLVQEIGARVREVRDGAILVEAPTSSLSLEQPLPYWIVPSTSPTPESDYARWQETLGAERWWFVSLYGRPADATHWSHSAENWLDGSDLEARFYPVQFVTPDQPSLICTIRPSFADALIPLTQQPPLFTPDRLQIRPDNVYYRAPDRFQELRRGSRIIFYVSAPEKSIRGHARITGLLVDTPEECLARYGNMGLFQFDALQDIAGKGRGRVLALAFDWYEEYERRPGLVDIRKIIPKYTPQAAQLVPFRVAQRLQTGSS